MVFFLFVKYIFLILVFKKQNQLSIIDTTGSHQFPAMQRLAMQRGNAFLLVYSVASRQSLEDLGPIVRTLKEVKGEQQMADVPVMLIGNKVDETQVGEG